MIPQVTPQQANAAETAQWKEIVRQAVCDLRVAVPGIIQSFDAVRQLAVVQVALRENVRKVVNTGTGQTAFKDVTISPLQDVPVVLPRGGGWTLTLPLKAGDECLLVFGDMARDYWWTRGGVQNQFEKRRHDLSDAFCVPGPWSNPRALSNYSVISAQLRSDDGTVVIDLATAGVTVTAPKVAVNASTSAVVTSPAVSIQASGGTPRALLMQAFLTWFEDTYMPSVKYVTTQPSNPTDVLTTVLEAQ